MASGFGKKKSKKTKRTNSRQFSEHEIISAAFKSHSEGDLKSASKYYQLFIDEGYTNPQVFSNFGVLCYQSGLLDKAINLYKKSIALYPDSPDAHANMGNILLDLGQYEKAEASTRIALRLKTDHINANNNLGIILLELGKFNEAELAIKKAIKVNPSCPKAHNNLGNILRKLRRFDESELSFRKAIELDGKFYMAYSNLGTVLMEKGKLIDAEESISKAITLKHNFLEAYINFGEVLKSLKKYQKAKDTLIQALAIFPDNSTLKYSLLEIYLTTCDWRALIKNKKWIQNKIKNFKPMMMMYIEEDPLMLLNKTKSYYQDKYYFPEQKINFQCKSKIRIAYISNNFFLHSTMILFTRILELHDKSKFEVYIYDFGDHENDQWTQRIINASDKYKIVKGISDLELVDLIRSDEVDIAVDLMGYVSKNRASIYSHRVAPVQVNYLDYPGTSGNDSIDYILADKNLIPENEECFYTEKVIRMDGVLQPTDDTLQSSNKKFTRSEFGIRKNHFVFSCFSKSKKIQLTEFQIWMNLLSKIDNSVLMLLEPNPLAKNNMLRETKNMNIDTSRLIFVEKISFIDHLSRQSCADLTLDTFNFSSGVMTYFALKGGIPILTLPGKTFSSRLCMSILKGLNLNELIATDKYDYERKAIFLAENPSYLMSLKEKIISLQHDSTYFKSSTYCRELENKFEFMIRQLSS